MNFQSQLSSLKANIMQPLTLEKHYLNSLQWNIEGAQKELQKQLEAMTESQRLPVVKSTRQQHQLPTVNMSLAGPTHAYKQFKKYGNDFKKKKVVKEGPQPKQNLVSSALSGVNPLSFTIKKVR